MDQQQMGRDRRPGVLLRMCQLVADGRRDGDHDHQAGQRDQVGGVVADQAFGQELSQSETARQDRRTVGAGQHEAGQHEEEVCGQIPPVEELMQRTQGDRRLVSSVEHHDEGGRKEA